jgi:hypothetical protein
LAQGSHVLVLTGAARRRGAPVKMSVDVPAPYRKFAGSIDSPGPDRRRYVNLTLRWSASVFVVCAVSLALAGCGQFRQQADAQFGDQNFKSAIALIELHKVRFGSYPTTLADLKFLGSWDQNWTSAVEYRKLDEGYELNVTRGWVGRPELEYPADFWHGIGVRKTNVKQN